jgi:hypothetical protein
MPGPPSPPRADLTGARRYTRVGNQHPMCHLGELLPSASAAHGIGTADTTAVICAATSARVNADDMRSV